jgi:UDP-hydrolysing UDP-N-acetyl-D-glucosamine 2-epimerase
MFGAPGVDEIKSAKLMEKDALFEKYDFSSEEAFIIVVQHPVTTEEDVREQIYETIQAIHELQLRTVIIYPNVDAGGRVIIEAYQELKSQAHIDMVKNIPRQEYLSLLKYASCLVGNSSSGIIEAPYFKLPVVNIGTRQKNRQRAGNVIDVEPEKAQIVNAVKSAISSEFIEKLDSIKSPYGEGDTGKKIAQVLAEVKIDDRLLNKSLTY